MTVEDLEGVGTTLEAWLPFIFEKARRTQRLPLGIGLDTFKYYGQIAKCHLQAIEHYRADPTQGASP